MFYLRINFWFGSTFCGSCLVPFPAGWRSSVQGRPLRKEHEGVFFGFLAFKGLSEN